MRQDLVRREFVVRVFDYHMGRVSGVVRDSIEGEIVSREMRRFLKHRFFQNNRKKKKQPAKRKAAPTTAKKTTKTTKKKKTAPVQSSPNKQKSGNGGLGRSKGPTYNSEDIKILLDVYEVLEPTSPDEWKELTRRFNLLVEDGRERDLESLKRKFGGIVGMKPPTGDPDLPKYVERALELQERLQRHWNGGW